MIFFLCFHLQIVVYFIREALEEDASGSLQASVDDIVYKAKRRKLLEKITNVRLGMVGTATGLDKKFQRKIVNIFLPINFNICIGCSKEPSN